MKLFNKKLELRAIKTICGPNHKLGGMLLAQLDQKYFHYPVTKTAWTRVSSLVKASGTIPEWEELVTDPLLPEEHRKLLIKSDEKRVKTQASLKKLIGSLDKYRKVRILYENVEVTLNELKKSSVDIEQLLNKNADALAAARSKIELSSSMLHFGKGNNSVPVIKKLLSSEKPNLIPTGYNAFDSINGGFIPGSLITIASTTGGGKSLLSNDMLKNMSIFGYDTCIVPLEMTGEETTQRILSNLSGIDLTKIIKKELTKNEKKLITKKYIDFVKNNKKHKSKYTVWSPEEDMAGEEIMMMLKPYGYKAIALDYVNLLKGVSDEDSVKQLGKISRFFKIFARINNILVIQVAQLSEEGKIKYARALAEHSNNAWIWQVTEEQKSSGTAIIDVRQPKARNQDPRPFQLLVDYKTMTVRDVTEKELAKVRTKEGDRKRSALDEFTKDINVADEDDET